MSRTLLWINKDARSNSLSQSFGKDEGKIRRHAQRRRWARTNQANLSNSCTQNSLNSERVVYAVRLDHDAAKIVSSQPGPRPTQHRTSPLHSSSQQERAQVSKLNIESRQDLIPAQVPSSIEVNLSGEERRSLDFFIHRTAPEWTGWEDTLLWNDVALRLSYSSQCIAHTLVALSALHESRLSLNDWGRYSSLAALSLKQRDRAIATAANTLQTSHLEALVSCLILICLQNVQNGHHSFRLLEAGRKMLDECQYIRLHPSEQLLVDRCVRPSFDLLRGRLCMLHDPEESLRVSIRRRRELHPWPTLTGPCIPLCFCALDQAQSALRQTFAWAHDWMVVSDDPQSILPYIKQTGTEWLSALEQSSSTGAKSQSQLASKMLLKAAYHFGIVLLETFQCTSEGIFDQYIETFALIVEAVEEAQRLTYLEKSRQEHSTSFGIDNGLVDIVAFTGQKCRDPYIRRRALNILIQSGRVEGGRLSFTAGLVMQALINKEERGLSKIDTASDILVSHRWHLLRGEQYFRIRKIRLVFERVAAESEESRYEETWIDLPEKVGAVDPDIYGEGSSLKADLGPPDTIIGRGFVYFLDDRNKSSYLKIEDGEFFFPIPRA